MKGGVLQVLELECGQRRLGKLAMQVGGRKCKKNGKGLVLFGPCWPNLGLNSDLNGAQKRAGIGLRLSWG